MSLSRPSLNRYLPWSMGRSILLAFTLDRFMVGLALLIVLAAAACIGPQSDTWWQLRTGEMIVRSGQVATTDSFSSTVRGGHWPNHEWLAQVFFYLCYAVGGMPLLVVVCAALITLTWCGVYRLCDGPPRVRALAILLGVASQSVIWSVRPHQLSLALLVVTLLLLPGRRRHWLYPPLFLLWANVHAGVAFGGAVLALAFVVALVKDRGASLHWLAVGAVSALATLVNPLGWGLWRYVFGTFGDTTRPLLQEWQPPNLGWPISYPFFALFLVWIIAVLRARHTWSGHRDLTLLALAVLFVLMGFRSIRHTAFFAVVAVPLLTRPFLVVPASARRAMSLGVLHLALTVAIVLGSVFVVRQTRAGMPEQPLAPGAVAAVRKCNGTLFNTYDTGGPLIWLVPERAVFIDNRQDPYPADLLFRAAIAEQQGEYQELFTTYHVSCALVPVDQAIYPALRRDGWEVLFDDAQIAVLRRDEKG